MMRAGFLCSRMLTGGPRLGFEWWRESKTVSGRSAHGPGPLHLIFYFSKLNRVFKL
jgi:hypothetical protein